MVAAYLDGKSGPLFEPGLVHYVYRDWAEQLLCTTVGSKIFRWE